jgi:hypothetical protein
MTEDQAKRQLQEMLRSFTPGSVLSLLADLYREAAAGARRQNDVTSYRRCRMVEGTLIVVGLGIDAACPR